MTKTNGLILILDIGAILVRAPPPPPPVTPAARAASALDGMRSFLIDSYSVSTRVSSIFNVVSRSGGAVGSGTVCGRRPTSKLDQLQHALKLCSLVASVSPVKRLSAGYALPSFGSRSAPSRTKLNPNLSWTF